MTAHPADSAPMGPSDREPDTVAGAAPRQSATGTSDVAQGDAPGGGHGDGRGGGQGGSVRVDSWIWSVRLIKSRSLAATACKGGHVRVNGERVKPAHGLRVGDEVRLRHAGRERIVVVQRLIRKRVGAPEAVKCYVDNSPPPPPREAVAPAGVRDRGAGRPTKRDRRTMDRLRSAGPPGQGSFSRPGLFPDSLAAAGRAAGHSGRPEDSDSDPSDNRTGEALTEDANTLDAPGAPASGAPAAHRHGRREAEGRRAAGRPDDRDRDRHRERGRGQRPKDGGR